jgi:predicted methyltransferase
MLFLGKFIFYNYGFIVERKFDSKKKDLIGYEVYNIMVVEITQFKWAGKKWFFEIKSNCEECDLTTATLKDMMKKEFKGKNVKLDVKPWLDNFFYCLFRGTWHAPIIMINGKKFHQHSKKDPFFNRRKLEKSVNDRLI